MRSTVLAGAFVALVSACVANQASSSAAGTAPSSASPPSASVEASASGVEPSAPAPPDLAARPLAWFAPLPPLPTGPGREYTGSDDFMALFAPNAAWPRAAGRIGVFKLYGEWVAYTATDDELRTAVTWIAQHGMALAVEMGPLDARPDCGEGVESFAGIDEGRLISDRIRAAGGRLQVVAMDEPFFYAHAYDGPNACAWPVSEVAGAVGRYVRLMRDEWPGLVAGDTEPMPAPVSPDDLAGWMDAYAAALGEPLAFLHLDVDWGRNDWAQLGLAVAAAGNERGVPIGMIYNGGAATSDATWVAAAGRRVIAYETAAGAAPDHVVFQSWMDKPDHVLPETDPTTLTGLIDAYFDDRATLGRVPGQPANLALDRPASASSSIPDGDPSEAVDGDVDTLWNAGAGPPAWIEIDLGAARAVAEIRLVVSQYPAGETRHQVSCGTVAGGPRTVAATLSGTTHDTDVLDLRLPSAMSCRYLRIDTLESPSWVAWREIEILGG